jgi:hypothetical protein
MLWCRKHMIHQCINIVNKQPCFLFVRNTLHTLSPFRFNGSFHCFGRNTLPNICVFTSIWIREVNLVVSVVVVVSLRKLSAAMANSTVIFFFGGTVLQVHDTRDGLRKQHECCLFPFFPSRDGFTYYVQLLLHSMQLL